MRNLLVVFSFVASFVVAETPALAQNVATFTAAEKAQILQAHNDVRAEVAAGLRAGADGLLPPASDMNDLYWDEGLEAVAKGWAATCPENSNPNRGAELAALAPSGVVRFELSSPSPSLGENIAFGVDSSDPPQRVIDGVGLWADGSDGYRYTLGTTDFALWGRFTQVAWANTRYVGCAFVSDCPSALFTTKVVCNYYPAGNFNLLSNFPWTAGTACTACDPDRIECTDNALCGGCPDPGPTTDPPDFCPEVIPTCAEGCSGFDECLASDTELAVACDAGSGLCEGTVSSCGVGEICTAAAQACVAPLQSIYQWTGARGGDFLDPANWFDATAGGPASVPPNNTFDTFSLEIETVLSSARVQLTQPGVVVDELRLQSSSRFAATLELLGGSTLDVLGTVTNLGGDLDVARSATLVVGGFTQDQNGTSGSPRTTISGLFGVEAGGTVQLLGESALEFLGGSRGDFVSSTISGGLLDVGGSVDVMGGSLATRGTIVSGDLDLSNAATLGGLLVEAKGVGAQIRLGPDGSAVQSNASILQALDGGNLDLGPAAVVHGSTRIFAGGTLTGTGTILGELILGAGGSLAPGNSPGTLALGSRWASEAGSRTEIELFGPASFDVIATTGTAELGGTLEILLGGGYTPELGDSFLVATWAGHVGTFDEVVAPPLGPGREWGVDYGTSGLTIFVPEPTSGFAVGALGLAFLARRRARTARRRRGAG